MSQTILVVDDSPTVVKFVTFSLQNSGYTVLSACDGMDAIEKISSVSGEISLIITDLNMPNLDGYSLIQTLRGSEQHAATPIIILSSEDGQDDRERGIEAGASSYLVKPFRSNRLLDEVAKFLKTTKN